MRDTENYPQAISHHILPTSSNLLGLCFVILSFIRVANMGAEFIIDELVAVAIFFFLVASILSYASMRAKKKAEQFEKAADLIFLAGLVLLSVISVVVVMEIL